MDSPLKVTDALSRVWLVDLHLGNLDALEEHAEFSLEKIVPKLSDKSQEACLPWHEFLADTLRIFDVFCALTKEQADALGLSKKDMRAGFTTDVATDAMTEATLDAIVRFFQKRNPARAAALRQSMKVHKQLMLKAAEKVTHALSKIDIDKLAASVPEISIDDAIQMELNRSKSSATAARAPSD